MRLIDADALLKEIDGIHQRHYANSCYQFIHDFFLAMFRRIRKAPTIDAVEVVHGRWENGSCTNCGQVDFSKPNYCPNCGAKMDLE